MSLSWFRLGWSGLGAFELAEVRLVWLGCLRAGLASSKQTEVCQIASPIWLLSRLKRNVFSTEPAG